jgi:hypothetical protein
VEICGCVETASRKRTGLWKEISTLMGKRPAKIHRHKAPIAQSYCASRPFARHPAVTLGNLRFSPVRSNIPLEPNVTLLGPSFPSRKEVRFQEASRLPVFNPRRVQQPMQAPFCPSCPTTIPAPKRGAPFRMDQSLHLDPSFSQPSEATACESRSIERAKGSTQRFPYGQADVG